MEILQNPFSYVGLLGFIWGIYVYVQKKREDTAKEAQATLQGKFDKLEAKQLDHDSRIIKVEDMDKVTYPKFVDMLQTVAALQHKVHTDHELRFTGIVTNAEAMRNEFNMRHANTEKAVDDIRKCFDKLENKVEQGAKDINNKIDINQKTLMDAIVKLSEGRH